MDNLLVLFKGTTAVFWRELLIIKKRLPKQIASWLVMPFLYLLAFHYAFGDKLVDGQPYSHFLLIGLMAMNSMMQSWAIASDINISRFYWHTFDEIQIAPIKPLAYVSGEVLTGISRAIFAALLVLLIGLIGNIRINFWSGWFWLAVFLNALIFSSLAVGCAMRVKSHADQAMLSSFVITPMAFLSGTFFPVEKLPFMAGFFLKILPLAHTNQIMQSAANQKEVPVISIFILMAWSLGSFIWAVSSVNKTTQ